MTNDSNEPAVERPGGISFGMVDAAVIRDETLPANVKSVYTFLATYCSDVRSAYPSKARIARGTGLSIRTVDGAITIAERVGLMAVERRPRGNRDNETNKYWLRDFGHGYILGSGPKTVEPPAADAGGVPQPVRESPAGRAGNLDNGSIPTDLNDYASGEDTSRGDAPPAASLGHSQASDPYRRIFKPRRFDRLHPDDVITRLTAAAMAAMKRAGLDVDPGAASDIHVQLTDLAMDGVDRYGLKAHAERWVNLAGTDDPEFGWMGEAA